MGCSQISLFVGECREEIIPRGGVTNDDTQEWRGCCLGDLDEASEYEELQQCWKCYG